MFISIHRRSCRGRKRYQHLRHRSQRVPNMSLVKKTPTSSMRSEADNLLHSAFLESDVKAFQQAIEAGADPLVPHILHLEGGSIPLVVLLLGSMARPSVQTEYTYYEDKKRAVKPLPG